MQKGAQFDVTGLGATPKGDITASQLPTKLRPIVQNIHMAGGGVLCRHRCLGRPRAPNCDGNVPGPPVLWVAASGMKNLTEPGPNLPLWSGDLAHPVELGPSTVGAFHYCASPPPMSSLAFNLFALWIYEKVFYSIPYCSSCSVKRHRSPGARRIWRVVYDAPSEYPPTPPT